MKMKSKILNIIILTILMTTSIFAKIPNWVKNNSHPEYPTEQYFISAIQRKKNIVEN